MFPQGKLDIAYAAYKDNIVNRSINKVLHEEILEILIKTGKILEYWKLVQEWRVVV